MKNEIKESLKVLFVGESWVTHSVHIKGFDSFTTNDYFEGGTHLIDSLKQRGIMVDYFQTHLAHREFPIQKKTLEEYSAIILSDIGSNSLFLHYDTFVRSQKRTNIIDLLIDFVRSGGGLLMIGGYMSFSGIEGKARYNKTALARILPVTMTDTDDRVEMPEGGTVKVVKSEHPVFKGIDSEWPIFLGYNKLKARAGCTVLAQIGKDVFISVGTYGKGRIMCFASDCGPHWAPREVTSWKCYGTFWDNSIRWLSGGRSALMSLQKLRRKIN